MFECDWTSEYYEILEFYYWEPQHLGRAKANNSRYSTPEAALKHIQRMEVSLNHMLKLFFRLIPSEVLSNFIADASGSRIRSRFQLLTRPKVGSFCELVQPDLIFQNDSINFSIEMKLEAKSSFEQVWKYALLHTLADAHDGQERSSYLMFLGKGEFSSIWKENIKSPNEVNEFLKDAELGDFKRKADGAERTLIDWERVRMTLKKTSILYWNYAALKAYFKGIAEPLLGMKGPEQTFVNLVNGLVAEFERRKLT